jgi:hypothetical protein
MQNWTEDSVPILTDRAKGALSLLIENVDLRLLGIGLRNLILDYITREEDREQWFNDFLEQLPIFYAFIDDLEEEYTIE